MAENPEEYPQEFADAMLKILDPLEPDNGAWFGRILAFKYQVKGFNGKDYDEETFRRKLTEGTIKVKDFTVEDVETDDMTVTGTAHMIVEEDGKEFKESYYFEHRLKKALHAQETVFQKITDQNEKMEDINQMTTTNETPPEWDLEEYRWFIWQYSRSLVKFSNGGSGAWFGRLTDTDYTADILGTVLTEDQIAGAIQGNQIHFEKFDPITDSLSYTDLGNGTAEAYCKAHITADINGNTVTDQEVEVTHQIHSYTGSGGNTLWIAASTVISI